MSVIDAAWAPILQKWYKIKAGWPNGKYFISGMKQFATQIHSRRHALVDHVVKIFSQDCPCRRVVGSLPQQIQQRYVEKYENKC